MATSEDIKSVRAALEESQAEFGSRFGVDQTTVHRWETKGLPERGAAKVAVETFLDAFKKEAAE